MISVPEQIKQLSAVFLKNGFALYLVGGFVRNAVLSLEPTDLDAASAATPDDVISMFKTHDTISVIPKATDFGTVEILIKNQDSSISVEHTTFRKDFYHDDGSHRPSAVAFTDSLEADALRRDFTINGIYYNIETETLIDPLSGADDLKSMTIRAAQTDPEKTLADDGLRIMRMARFAAELGFKVSPDLFQAARRYVHYLADISPERKQTEIKKILLSDITYQGYNGAFNASKPKRGLMILMAAGALKYIFPALDEGGGVMQNRVYHAHDVLLHNINTMASTTPSYPLRLAGLLHDIAKPRQLKATGKMHYHDTVGSAMARQALEAVRTPNSVIDHVCQLIENHMFDLEGRATEKTIRKKAKQLGFDRMMELADLRRADIVGSGIVDVSLTAERWIKVVNAMKEANVPETVRGLAVNGSDLMAELNLTEGWKIGRLLDRLHDITLHHPKQNTRESLLRHAKKILRESEFKHD